MCNAWNHSINCTCGWGGKGHAGRRSAGNFPASYWPAHVPHIAPHFESYTNPNARCPVCAAPVFYYCNENGSSVFFDELGPPWPKHPCTNNSKVYIPLALDNSERSLVENNFQWGRSNWNLYYVVSASNIDGTVFKTLLRKGRVEIEVFIPKADLEYYKYVDIFRNGSVVFLNKTLRENNLSLLTPLGREIFLTAYDSLFNVPRHSATHKKRK